ncbi:MAG TPA: metal-dependent hydrolase [Pyrinomonadaceae bacterium]
MDNLTHSLVGLTAAKAGLDKLSPGATTLCVLAANAPDSDVFIGLFSDRWTLLHHHRGITHSIIGTLSLAVALPLLFYVTDTLLARWRNRPPQVKFRGLLIASAIVTATHPLLDWTNSYGIRPFLPWDSRWAYGDLLYIVDPFIWLLLGCASFQLTSRTRFQRTIWAALALFLTGLVAFGPARRVELSHPNMLLGMWIACVVFSIYLFIRNAGERWQKKIAITALVLLVAYCASLTVAHRLAVTVARDQAVAIANEHKEVIARFAVMPTLANPFRWDCTFTTESATYRFRLGLIDRSRTGVMRYPVPTGSLAKAIEQISQDRRARIFLNFARFPVAQLRDETCSSQTLVEFADLRYTEPGRGRGNFTLDLPVDCHGLEVRAR